MCDQETLRPNLQTGFWVVVLLIGILGLPLSTRAQETRAKTGAVLLVANKHDDTLCFINPNTLEIVQTIVTGPNPHEIIITPDRRFAYLSNYAPPDNTISVIDLVQRKHLWAANQTGGSITIIDLATYKPLGTFDCPGMPVRICFTHDGKLALVPSWTKEGQLIVIDMDKLAVEAVIRTGDGPDHMSIWFPPGTRK